MTIIKYVRQGSYAERAGILPEDILISINQNPITDVLDYRFYLTEPFLTLTLRRGEREYTVGIKKGQYDDIGLEFDTPLMDKKHRCANKCIFCFIDQLPSGMRESLYFKDDDSRLSFLHGNYITLTNLDEGDIDRIIKMHISPLRVSVHTTDPDLRVKMMKNPRAGEVLRYIGRIAEAGISIDAQIVVCRGVNDGEHLDRTLSDLLSYYPALNSVSVVPAGLTRHREGLYPLSPFTREEAATVISQVNAVGDRCESQFGERIIYAADELYLSANIPLPSAEFYGGFAQIEDGVGLIASLDEEFGFALEDALLPARLERHISLATGEAAYPLLCRLADTLCRATEGLKISVYAIKNNFFGNSVTVAGLLTGADIEEQLTGEDLGDELIIPGVALRGFGSHSDEELVFLDDKTPAQLSTSLGIPVTPAPNDGYALLDILLGKK